MKSLTASDRKTLIRLASSLPVGDETRKAILTGLAQTREAGRKWKAPHNKKYGPAKTMPDGKWKTKNLGDKCWSYLPESERTESDRCYTGVGKVKFEGDSTTDRAGYNAEYRKKRWDIKPKPKKKKKE